eukprot:CAMPEP_0113241130 /NCGR_PEP_ID=MMETSP0008_2-20120614/6632_1 /TAXON_ID=97485 /ORGANISM="Prymnesium parvum" /LENGTH=67 /DNA_ID=CAMNT_0000088517 /DNA_START=1056 /DNA_END=1259 /DNA_ORIENTATION=+ /assembly_acc=CAM_ASM_000153
MTASTQSSLFLISVPAGQPAAPLASIKKCMGGGDGGEGGNGGGGGGALALMHTGARSDRPLPDQLVL